MHTALENVYILHAILEFLENDRKACSMAALTCRSFRDTAQETLWRNLDCGVFPIFQLLSNLDWEVDWYGPRQDEAKTWYLKGPPIRADMDNLRWFGRCVRSTTNERNKKGLCLHASVYVTVGCELHGQPLFPNLRYLNIQLNQYKYKYSPFLPLLSSSSRMTYIRIATNSPFGWAPDVSCYIQGLVPSTSLSFLHLKVPANQALIDSIPSFPNLHTLHLDGKDTNVSLRVLRLLSQFPSLIDLHLAVRSFDWDQLGEEDWTLVFPCTQELSLTCDLDRMIDLLSRTQFPALIDITHSFIVPYTEIHTYRWKEFFDALRRCTNASEKLTGIFLHPSKNFSNPMFVHHFLKYYPGVPFTDIADSLLPFNLSNLSLRFPLFESLSNDNIKAMCEAWPELISLVIRCRSDNDSDAHVPDTSVFQLVAEGFSDLEILELDMSAIGMPYRTSDVSNHRLDRLNVRLVGWEGYLGAVNAPNVAASFAMLVDMWFPHLSFFDHVVRVTGKEDGHIATVWSCLWTAGKLERQMSSLLDDEEESDLSDGGDDED